MQRRELIHERRLAWDSLWQEATADQQPLTYHQLAPFLWNQAILPHPIRRSHQPLVTLLAQRLHQDGAPVTGGRMDRIMIPSVRRVVFFLSGLRHVPVAELRRIFDIA